MIDMRIKYWGVRGSIPAPLTTEEVREKEVELVKKLMFDFDFREKLRTFEEGLQGSEGHKRIYPREA